MAPDSIEQVRAYTEYVIRGLVDLPEELRVTAVMDERSLLISVQVSKPDMGKVIGREGQTAQALRTILHSVGKKAGLAVSLKILEPDTVGRQTMRDAFKDLS